MLSFGGPRGQGCAPGFLLNGAAQGAEPLPAQRRARRALPPRKRALRRVSTRLSTDRQSLSAKRAFRVALRRATVSARRWAPRARMCLPAALDRLRWASAAATGFRGGPEASSFKGASPPGACPAARGRCCIPLGEGRAVDTYPPAAINDAGCGNGPRPFGLSPRARNASLLVSCWCLPAPSSRLALRARGGNGGASSRRICPKGCFMRRSFLISPWAKARDSFFALMCAFHKQKTPAK